MIALHWLETWLRHWRPRRPTLHAALKWRVLLALPAPLRPDVRTPEPGAALRTRAPLSARGGSASAPPSRR